MLLSRPLEERIRLKMSHEVIKCTVCGAELHFQGYATKMGKDGRIAKWAVYEPCPNKEEHYRFKQGYKTTVVTKEEPVVDVPFCSPESRLGLSFSWGGRAPDVEGVIGALKKYKDKYSKTPETARVNVNSYVHFKAIIDGLGISLGLSVDPRFTKQITRMDLDV